MVRPQMNCATALVEFVTTNAQISLDPLAARAHYIWALCCEQTGTGPNIRRALLAAHRTVMLELIRRASSVLLNVPAGHSSARQNRPSYVA